MAENLALALGEGAAAALRRARAVVGEQCLGQLRLEQHMAGVDRADRAGQCLRVDVLVDVPGGAGPQRGDHGAVLGEAGDDEDPGPAALLLERAQRLDAVDAGHLEVHQDHVGVERAGPGDALGAVGGLADHLDVVLHLQEGAQAAADDLVVVDQQDADRGQGVRHRGPPSRRSCPFRGTSPG